MSLPIAVPIAPAYTEDRIASIECGITDCAAMCSALGEFLATAFPHAAKEAENFENWLERYLNHNNKEYLESLLNPPAMPPGYMPFDPTEQLVYLCKRRDNIQEQLDGFEEMVSKLEAKAGEETGDMMRSQLKLFGIPQQLEDLNEQISNLQRSIEAKAK